MYFDDYAMVSGLGGKKRLCMNAAFIRSHVVGQMKNLPFIISSFLHLLGYGIWREFG